MFVLARKAETVLCNPLDIQGRTRLRELKHTMQGVLSYTCIPELKTTTAMRLLAEGLPWQTLCITLPGRSSSAELVGSSPPCWRCGFKELKVT